MNSWLARRMYFTLQYLRGEPVGQALDDVRRTEFASLDALRFIQAERQLTQLRFALRYVPWYQRAYAPFADQIETARTWQDVNHLMGTLPVVERDAVMEAFDEFASQNASNLKTYPDRTSGSSGTPLMFACDQTAWAYRHALLFRCMEAFGVNVGEPYALFFGLHWNMGIRLKTRMRDLSLNRVRISAYDIEPKSLNRHLRNIREHGPTHFIGYPSAIYDFCSLLRDRGLDLRNLQLKAVFLTAEPLRSHQRGLIEETTASKCVNIYGSAEGGLNAFECPHGSLHLASEATWLQLREPNGGRGQAVVTDMMLRAFPLIRYAIGDEVVFKSGACPCGRPHPMLQSIEGRCGDPILLPNGRRINANLPSYIFKPLSALGVIRRYRFVQASDHELELYLVVRDSFREEHLRVVEGEVRAAFGEDIPLSIRLVQELAHLPNAKHRDYVRTY